MKHLKLLSIICTLVIIFMVPLNVSAAETAALPDPGTTPGSPFYFMDKWGKHISMMFTFNVESKVKKSLQFAEERLAEMQAMEEQNRVQYMEQAASEYQNYLKIATQNMEQALEKGVDTTSHVTAMMMNHIAIMNNENNTGSEDSLQIRIMTREMAETCQESAIRTLAAEDPEKALEINLALMQQECERISNKLNQEESTGVDDDLQQYERLQAMNQEIIATATQIGKGTEAQRMLDQVLTNQLQVLNQIREEVQIQRGGLVIAPVQNKVAEQEQTNNGIGSGEQVMSAPETGGTVNANGADQPNGSGDNFSGTNGTTGATTVSAAESTTGGNQGGSSGSGKK